MKNHGVKTPKGTPPRPMRRAAKHKTATYGSWLIAKANERRKRRPARAAKPTQGGAL